MIGRHDFAVGQILRDDTALGGGDYWPVLVDGLLMLDRLEAGALPLYLEKPVGVDTLIATATALIGQGRRPASGSAGLQGTDRAG